MLLIFISIEHIMLICTNYIELIIYLSVCLFYMRLYVYICSLWPFCPPSKSVKGTCCDHLFQTSLSVYGYGSGCLVSVCLCSCMFEQMNNAWEVKGEDCCRAAPACHGPCQRSHRRLCGGQSSVSLLMKSLCLLCTFDQKCFLSRISLDLSLSSTYEVSFHR